MRSKNSLILFADANSTEQILLARAFRRLRIPNPLRCVNSGNEAIAYLNGEGKFADRSHYPYPSFIITDLAMPQGDGLKLLENVRNNPGWAVIPRVVFSDSADPDDIKKSYILGASSYFVKPGTLEEMEALLKSFFDYWMRSETPEMDASGKQLYTESAGRVGERFAQPGQSRKLRTSARLRTRNSPHGGKAKRAR